MNEVTDLNEIIPYADLDSAWKEILRKYFKDFVELCWPAIFDKIEWSKGYDFLEQEFHAILQKEEIGKRITDKLVRVWRKDGVEAWVLLQIEIQGSRKSNFSERVYIYRYRIFDLYKRDIATLAILIDGDIHWRPNHYENNFWGTRLRLEYPILKILDFRTRKAELEASQNPFSIAILAQLAAIETSKSQETRLLSKYSLTKQLYLRNWEKEAILDLLRFFDEIMTLSESFLIQCNKQVEELEKELNMVYMTPSERLWLKQGESTFLTELLEYKFKHVPQAYLERINQADPETLLKWGRRVLIAQSLEAVFNEQ